MEKVEGDKNDAMGLSNVLKKSMVVLKFQFERRIPRNFSANTVIPIRNNIPSEAAWFSRWTDWEVIGLLLSAKIRCTKRQWLGDSESLTLKNCSF